MKLILKDLKNVNYDLLCDFSVNQEELKHTTDIINQ